MPPLVCPECGNDNFVRIEGGSYTEKHFLWFGGRQAWEDREDEVMDTQPWVCTGLHHVQPDDIQDAIEEALMA